MGVGWMVLVIRNFFFSRASLWLFKTQENRRWKRHLGISTLGQGQQLGQQLRIQWLIDLRSKFSKRSTSFFDCNKAPKRCFGFAPVTNRRDVTVMANRLSENRPLQLKETWDQWDVPFDCNLRSFIIADGPWTWLQSLKFHNEDWMVQSNIFNRITYPYYTDPYYSHIAILVGGPWNQDTGGTCSWFGCSKSRGADAGSRQIEIANWDWSGDQKGPKEWPNNGQMPNKW